MTGKMYPSNQADLIKAYAIIFTGNRVKDLRDLLKTDIAALKAAYRNRIMENHPDRSKVLGINHHVLTERFKIINRAYADLSSFIENAHSINTNLVHRHKPAGKNKKSRPKNRTRSTTPNQHRGNTGTGSHQGQTRRNETQSSQKPNCWDKNHWMPNSEVLLGQYLFFSRVISLTSLIEAIIWQRQQRPYFGAIAREWRILSGNDISTIYRNKKPKEKFGECALRMGFINSFQHRAILCKQKNSQKPIGQFFIEKKMLTEDELKSHLLAQKRHNQTFL